MLSLRLTRRNSVRAGMIFVTMDDTDLLSKTDYTIHYEDDDEDNGSSGDEMDFRLLDDPCETAQDEEESLPHPVFRPGLNRAGNAVTQGLPRPNLTVRAAPASSSSSLWANLDEYLSRPQPPVELLEPNATFSHNEGKTKCIINFEPAMCVSAPLIFISTFNPL